MWGILKDENEIYTAELKAPSGFSETPEVIGGYNTTLRGTKRRFIKAIKKSWSITYDILTVSEMVDIQALYDTLQSDEAQTSQPYIIFSVYDADFGISNESVHMDISERSYVPGTNKLSSVTLVLSQL